MIIIKETIEQKNIQVSECKCGIEKEYGRGDRHTNICDSDHLQRDQRQIIRDYTSPCPPQQPYPSPSPSPPPSSSSLSSPSPTSSPAEQIETETETKTKLFSYFKERMLQRLTSPDSTVHISSRTSNSQTATPAARQPASQTSCVCSGRFKSVTAHITSPGRALATEKFFFFLFTFLFFYFSIFLFYHFNFYFVFLSM